MYRKGLFFKHYIKKLLTNENKYYIMIKTIDTKKIRKKNQPLSCMQEVLQPVGYVIY
jgi:hypothetical protein